MPASLRRITPEDILPDAAFALQRRERRLQLLPTKHLRRVALGPFCTFYFECFETMLFQVQEMLLTEKGGAAQLVDEMAAYNPLIPQGRELIATVMFEIEDEARRTRLLAGLGGVEGHFQIRIGEERITGIPESDVERSREGGRTSSVHFLRFPFSPAQIAAFRAAQAPILIACDDPRYPHLAELGPEVRTELIRDFAS